MTNDLTQQKANFQETSLRFIEIEMELARTFCKISQEADDEEKRERNREHARRAFNSAKKALGNFSEPGDQWAQAKAALDDLENRLTCL